MNEELGSIIAKARKESKLSQEELAKKINVTRQAISNWENNKCFPDISILHNLCNVLNLDYDKIFQLVFGDYKRKNKRNIIVISSIFIIIITIIIIISIVVLNRNKFNLYSMSIDNKDININGGTLLLSKVKNYLVIGSITSDVYEINNNTNIRIYQKENDKEERLILLQDYNDNIVIQESYGYGEYFSDELDLNNIYLDITINEETKTYKIIFNKEVKGDKLLYFKNRSIGNESNVNKDTSLVNANITDKILLNNGYNKISENQYSKEVDGVSWHYSGNIQELSFYITNESNTIDATYDISFDVVYINNYNLSNGKYEYKCGFYSDGRIQEDKGSCDEASIYKDMILAEYEKLNTNN